MKQLNELDHQTSLAKRLVQDMESVQAKDAALTARFQKIQETNDQLNAKAALLLQSVMDQGTNLRPEEIEWFQELKTSYFEVVKRLKPRLLRLHAKVGDRYSEPVPMLSDNQGERFAKSLELQ